jgi:hypothetical protein
LPFFTAAVGMTTAALGLGCARTPPLTPPERGGAAWVEVASSHFVLDTDLSAEEATKVSDELEKIYVSLEAVAFPSNHPTRSKVRVIFFAHNEDYLSVAPKGSGGYYMSSLPNEPNEGEVFLGGGVTRTLRLTLQHELTHSFVHRSLGPIPRWLSEGLAQYYSTFSVHDGSAYLGEFLPDLGVGTNADTWHAVREGAGVRTLIPAASIPSVAQVIHGDLRDFLAVATSAHAGYDEARRQTAYYFGAYGLVHMFYSDPVYNERFDAMINLLRKGATGEEAWEKTLGVLPEDQLEKDYREHLYKAYSVAGMVKRTDYTPPAIEPGQLRNLSPADVHILWARLRKWPDDAKARADVEAAAALDPTSPEIQYWVGAFSRKAKDYKAAEASLQKALEQRPNDARYLTMMATTLEQDRSASPGSAEPFVERLAKVALSAHALDFLARYYGNRKRMAEAMPFAQRALKADPTCSSCAWTIAHIAVALDDLELAVAAQKRAVAMLGDRESNPQWQVELAQFQQLLEAKRKKATE